MAQVNAGRVRFIGRGEYNNSTQYYTFDLVNYNGNSYFAKSNTLGNLPTNTTYWQLVAEKGNVGSTGPTGNGIASITKTSTSGLVDTYTITFTSGNTTTFNVTNGNGIDHISLTSQSGATKVYTIYFTDGNTTTYTVEDGEVTQEVFDEEVDRLKMVYNAMPKVSDEGTDLTLNNTAECPVYDIELSPSELNQEADPTPDNPQQIHTVSGENTITISNSDNTQSQTYPISLGNLEYCKIGNYEDVFFKNVVGSEYYDSTLELDKWYLKKNIGKVVLDGSETWTSGITSPAGNYRCISTIIQNLVLRPSSANVKIPMYSNYYVAKTYNETYLREQGVSIGSNGNLGIYDNNFVTDDISLYKAWLSTHNLTLYYPLATPTYTLLSNTLQTQLDNLAKAISHQDQTNVSQTNADLPFVIKLSAIRDLSGIFELIQ